MEDEKSEKPMIKFIGFFYLCAMRVAFTGHRDYSGTTNEKLREVIIALYEVGYSTFLCGMAEGFDIAAAEIVLSLKSELNGLKLPTKKLRVSVNNITLNRRCQNG